MVSRNFLKNLVVRNLIVLGVLAMAVGERGRDTEVVKALMRRSALHQLSHRARDKSTCQVVASKVSSAKRKIL